MRSKHFAEYLQLIISNESCYERADIVPRHDRRSGGVKGETWPFEENKNARGPAQYTASPETDDRST